MSSVAAFKQSQPKEIEYIEKTIKFLDNLLSSISEQLNKQIGFFLVFFFKNSLKILIDQLQLTLFYSSMAINQLFDIFEYCFLFFSCQKLVIERETPKIPKNDTFNSQKFHD